MRELIESNAEAGRKNEPNIDITVFIALSPHSVMLSLVEKLTELGVKAIVPYISERASGGRSGLKKDALSMAAGAAARRSGRGFIPPVYATVEFNEMLSLVRDYPVKLFFYEQESRNDLKKHIKGHKKERKIAIIIGPPGGITLKEAEKLRTLVNGAISLGRRLMKSDTAALAAVAAVMYEYDELGLGNKHKN